MKFTDELFEEVKELWDRYLEHPFVKGIGEGTLDKEKFKKYLIQDYLYLKDYAKVFALGLVKAKTMKDMKFYSDSIRGTLEDETQVHTNYLRYFGLSDEAVEKYRCELTTASYTSYMLAIASKGGSKEIAMTIMPCTWSYYYIGKKLKETYKENLEDNFYKSWIESYSCEGYEQVARTSIEFVNTLSENIDENKKEKLKDIFIKASIHEMKFWDMAYEEVK